jgi:hypothetical protein
MKRIFSVALTALIVVSLMTTGLTPAAASSSTYTETIQTDAYNAEIGLSNVTTVVKISVVADNTTLLEKQVNGSQKKRAYFRNAGAYDAFTIEVSGADAPPSFTKGSSSINTMSNYEAIRGTAVHLGSTGGDKDHSLDTMERIAQINQPIVPQLDATPTVDSRTVNTTNIEAHQIHNNLYQTGLSTHQSYRNYLTAFNNSIQDSESIALMKGKAAYIRSLNNGSSQPAAANAADIAISDYYATQERNLLNDWNTRVETYRYIVETSAQTTGLSSHQVVTIADTPWSFGDFNYSWNATNHGGTDTPGTAHTLLTPNSQSHAGNVNYRSDTHQDVSLLNGDKMRVESYRDFEVHDWKASDGFTKWNPTTPGSNTDDFPKLSNVAISRKGSSHKDNETNLLMVSAYNQTLHDLRNQSQSAQAQMDTFVTGTYSEYQQGEINNTDIQDPYVLNNQFSAGGEYQGWAVSQLTTLGLDTPNNLSTTGYMNVSIEGGNTQRGIIMSHENPESGSFEVGETYHAGNIGGLQYFVGNGQTQELTGQFTLQDATTSDGKTVKNVTIEKKVYNTGNIDDLKTQYDQLQDEYAELEARQQNLRSSNGTPLLDSSGGTVVLVAGGVGVLLLLGGRNRRR